MLYLEFSVSASDCKVPSWDSYQVNCLQVLDSFSLLTLSQWRREGGRGVQGAQIQEIGTALNQGYLVLCQDTMVRDRHGSSWKFKLPQLCFYCKA